LAYELWLELQRRGRRRRRNHMEEERESSNTHFKGCAAGSSVGKHHSNKQKIIIPINFDNKKFENLLRIKNSGNSSE
jgi:hypothetical protein